MFYKSFFVIITSLSLLCCKHVFADMNQDRFGGPRRGYDYELKLLPSYCTPKLRTDDYLEERKIWREKFNSFGKKGEDYRHCHHYCEALIGLNRLRQNVGNRKDLIGFVEGHLLYMIKHSNSDFILMPDILTRMIYIQNLKGDQIKAQYYLKYLEKIKKRK